MYSLIAFASQWGSKHGGINSFNTDLLSAFGIAYFSHTQVICVVEHATPEEIQDALNANVQLVELELSLNRNSYSDTHTQAVVKKLVELKIIFNPDHTVWLGHDLITGKAAIEVAKQAGGLSALIHHMSYEHYESYAENSKTADLKEKEQKALFGQASLVMAVGPLLRDALQDLLGLSNLPPMLIPGLAEIEPKKSPNTFTAFLSGRLHKDTARIKQTTLGVAAFAHAHRIACENNGKPDSLYKKPKLKLRGVDFESPISAHLQVEQTQEDDLKEFAENYANAVINLQALPYTTNRDELFDELSGSSVALMPSWHEGFGLVAWEAIAAGVPLIISKASGVFKLLEEELAGTGTGSVHGIDVKGSNNEPYFHKEDLECVANKLVDVAYDIVAARKQASLLRSLLSEYTWPSCAEKLAEIFNWPLQKGIIPEPTIQAAPLTAATSPLDDSPLKLPAKHWRSDGTVSDSWLLRAEEALVPFDPARQPDLNALNTWLDDTQFLRAVRLITGAGGVGKTRLALELCRSRMESGWHAGFLDNDLVDKDMNASWKTLQSRNQPLLIVIDYAETRQEALLSLVRTILRSECAHPVRLLLLARDGGEWWENLPGKDKDCESLLSSYATTGPYALPTLHADIQSRSQAYLKALNAFGSALHVSSEYIPSVVPELSGEHFGRPLYLQMAALLALHGERPSTPQGLTTALLNHERRYWKGVISDIPNTRDPERYAEQLLALTTLAGGFNTIRNLQPYWKKIDFDAISPAYLDSLYHALKPLYPGKQGLQPVRPDLLGEALVARALQHYPQSDLLNAVLDNNASQAVRRHALTVLARLSSQYQDVHEIIIEALARNFAHCAHDIVAVATETHSDLPKLATEAFNRLITPNLKSQVAGLLNQHSLKESVQLSALYCSVTEYLKDKSHDKLKKHPNNIEYKGNYAAALGNFSVTLSRIGRDDLALEHAKQSMEIRQRLAQKNPDRFEPCYASSLNNYANSLSKVGKYEDALEHAKQSMEIRQRLAQKNPDRLEPDYAMSLNNYASHLSNVGRYEEALETAKESLKIRQHLAQQNPDRFEPDYASSLNNYASHLSNVGRYEEALETAKESMEIYQRLAQKNSDRFAPDYASSLNNYANSLSKVGKYEDALEHAKQSMEIRQRLAQKNPDRFEPGYASSLNNYANSLNKVGKYEDALEHAKQSMEIRQRLAQKNPDRFEPDYAMSLNNYASHLSDVGRYEEALETAKESLKIHQRLALKNPDRFAPDYAMSLNNYASHLSDVGRYEEALEHAKQSMEIRQRLTQKNPARFADEEFCACCFVRFLDWLLDPASPIGELSAIPKEISPHRRQILLINKTFVEACQASENHMARTEAFTALAAIYGELTKESRAAVQDFWLCSAAWCAAFIPETIINLNWKSDWHQYVTRKKGNMPHWMNIVAQRLRFRLPE